VLAANGPGPWPVTARQGPAAVEVVLVSQGNMHVLYRLTDSLIALWDALWDAFFVVSWLMSFSLLSLLAVRR
jgi:hypothetical protein